MVNATCSDTLPYYGKFCWFRWLLKLNVEQLLEADMQEY